MRLFLPPDVARGLLEAVSLDDVERFKGLASGLKWGKPSWSASQLLITGLGHDSERLLHWGEALSRDTSPLARRYAPEVLFKMWSIDRERAEETLETLADDEHWLVRESAHGVWADLLKEDFGRVYGILFGWAAGSSPNRRRCVAIAARSAGNLRRHEWVEPLVQLLEPLLSDRHAYVRKNVGPYAIGDGLLRCYPELILRWLRVWAGRMDEGTRWNVAMAFASYGGNVNWLEGVEILSELAQDERRYVWRAVASAMVYLGRRHPEVLEVLEAWRTDAGRRRVADEALKFLNM